MLRSSVYRISALHRFARQQPKFPKTYRKEFSWRAVLVNNQALKELQNLNSEYTISK